MTNQHTGDGPNTAGEFSRTAARIAMLVVDLERIADRGGISVPAPALTNMRYVHAAVGALLLRVAEKQARGQSKEKAAGAHQ